MDNRTAIIEGVDIVSFIGQYITLTQAGNEFKGRCPFHDEKTASFHVNPEKRMYHCFGCKAGGSVFDFVMAIENLEFKDALAWLAKKYNITLEAMGKKQAAQAKGKERMYTINTAATKWFREQLVSPAGEGVRSYMKKRGVTNKCANDFELGYAPREWSALGDFLMSHGAKAGELMELGLVKKRDKGGGHYDVFRDRLIFPMRSVTGRVVGFAGRALSSEDNPKYLNVKNTPLYDKSNMLFNLDQAKASVRENGIIIVEGHMDVISMHQGGLTNTIATCGTAFTEQHIRTMMRYTDYFNLAYDSDEAGIKATWKASLRILEKGFDPKIIQFPKGMDPDDWLKSVDDPDSAWKELVVKSTTPIRFWLGYKIGNRDPDPQVVKKLVLQLRALYHALPDVLIQREIRNQIVGELRLNEAEVRGLLDSDVGIKRSSKAQDIQRFRDQVASSGTREIETDVMRLLLTSEEFLLTYAALRESEHTDSWFVDPIYREMFRRLMEEGSVAEIKGDSELADMVAEMLTVDVVGDPEKILRRHSNAYYKRLIGDEEAAYKASQDAKPKDSDDRYGLNGVGDHMKRVKALRKKIMEVA